MDQESSILLDENGQGGGQRRESPGGKQRTYALVLGLTTFVIGLLTGVFVGTRNTDGFVSSFRGEIEETAVTLISTTALETGEGRAALVLDELSPEEIRAVSAKVVERLSAASSSKNQKNKNQPYLVGVNAVEWETPRKAEVLAFLDGETKEVPKRYARATVARPETADVMVFRVGPISGTRKAPSVGEEFEALYGDGEIPIAKMPPDICDESLSELIAATMEGLRPVLEPVFPRMIPFFEDTYKPEEVGTVFGFPIFPDLKSTPESRVMMVKFFWIRDGKAFNNGMWMHPTPLVFQTNHTMVKGGEEGPFVSAIYWCGRGPFGTVQDVLDAKIDCEWEVPAASDGSSEAWDTPIERGAVEEKKKVKGKKKRTFSVSAPEGTNGRYVKWKGWEFFVTQRLSTGMSVWDIRFRGKRIVYELSLQESAAIYGGGQGDQTYYLDTAMTGMGQITGIVRPGVDCPEDAVTFWNSAWVYGEFPRGFFGDPMEAFSRESGCIFELDTGTALWSHVDQSRKGKTMGISRKSLIVRAISNSGNYDYIASAIFDIDGSLHFEMRLAGMAETRWIHQKVNAWEADFSTLIHSHLAAPMHTHYINVKVDLDIGQPDKNGIHVMRSLSGYPQAAKEAGALEPLEPLASKYIVEDIVKKEGPGNSTVVPDPHRPAVWRVISMDQKTADQRTALCKEESSWSCYPGYALVASETVRNTLPDDHPLSKMIGFAKYTMAFTKQHDDEQRSSTPFDTYAPQNRTGGISVDVYLEDGESLEGADVVAWATLAHEHIPRSEDAPLISNYPVRLSVLPWNYFPRHAAMEP
uniref:Amine oxidase n=1 Tax=Chromera velia CCMP2878 TaxID=1169474 RepID=A0A0G4GDF6_9ALVE|eukprot:Cvel_643.t1-p1 / transcript=Cvel_643.t1 / gene=Cvel_643 / organism=Chromera_velia_CCMP2878 / gene_product=Amiloride-sensitive amine oxidase, putative / transcript_product=Amiloride-sensitive amine oxidase, putative / location=Cvel_scaffold19:188963-192410(+) / protein_length=809 / sequence_SO=supercontig / SO=protein_coding / is_pseudo=false